MKKIAISLALVLALSASVMAADWSFYSSTRMQYVSIQDDTATSPLGMNASSRYGAKVKVSENLSGQVEFSYAGGLRIFSADYKSAFGIITVGQTYTPLFITISNSIYGNDNVGLYYGGIYSARCPMVQIVPMAGLKIAAVSPLGGATPQALRLQASYAVPETPVTVFGSYVQDGHMIGVAEKVKMGSMWVNGDLWIANNTAKVGMTSTLSGFDSGAGNVTGALVAVGTALDSMLSVEAGFGYVKNESTDAGTLMYVQAPMTLEKGVIVVPEVGQLGASSKKSYAQVKMQIDL